MSLNAVRLEFKDGRWLETALTRKEERDGGSKRERGEIIRSSNREEEHKEG